MTEYAKQSDLDRLVFVVEKLSEDFSSLAKESRNDIRSLSVQLATQTTMLSGEVTRLSNIMQEININMKELINSNIRRSVIVEWIKNSPKVAGILFSVVSIFLGFFFSKAPSSLSKYLIELAKAKYGVQ